jgi:alkanesulfonate monooxygenase SsuD/methylene tetrahydromethanopterin reductase-like flavin-dependent oxidoreductase (luciferase family)
MSVMEPTRTSRRLEFGFCNLGDSLVHPIDGSSRSDATTHKRLIEQAVAAETAGLGLFQLGEHHFNYYSISAPFVALASIAAHTSTLRLGTGVTLITTADPVVVAEGAATLDVMSDGRAEIAVGRGIHKPIFDVTGRSTEDATALLEEGTELLARLLTEDSVSWEGRWRPPLHDVTIRPRPVQDPIPLWAASTSSIDLTARLGLPVMWGTVVYPYQALEPFAARYRQAWVEAGRSPADIQVGIGAHYHVARTSQEARKRYEPHYRHYLACGASLTRSALDRALAPIGRDGSLFDSVPIFGSPEEVVDKIGHAQEMLGLTRIALTMDMGGQSQDVVLEMIELTGSEVIPHFSG